MKRLLPLLLAFFLIPVAAFAEWDYANPQIAIHDIQSGGPPKDGIPALTEPEAVFATEADFLTDDEMVIGFFHNDEAKAYPLRLMSWHEIVNDLVGGEPILVSW